MKKKYFVKLQTLVDQIKLFDIVYSCIVIINCVCSQREEKIYASVHEILYDQFIRTTRVRRSAHNY